MTKGNGGLGSIGEQLLDTRPETNSRQRQHQVGHSEGSLGYCWNAARMLPTAPDVALLRHRTPRAGQFDLVEATLPPHVDVDELGEVTQRAEAGTQIALVETRSAVQDPREG